MATIDKNFRIKHGLVVEGTTGTINQENILTEGSGDSYILSLIGGTTLVKSVGTNLSVDGAGLLSLDLAGIVEDVAGTRLYATGSTINVDVEGIYDDMIDSGIATTQNITDAISTLGGQTSTDISNAIQTAEDYTDTAINGLTTTDIEEGTNLYFTNQRALDATSSAYDAAGSASTAQGNAEDYADGLISTEVTNRNSAISTAKGEAIFDAGTYTDSAISTEVTNRNDAIATAKSEAISAAEGYTDTAVANVVGAAPELLDTLNELAAALQDNPDIISDLQDVAAGKQDTLTAGNGIDITGDTISVAFDAGNGLAINGVNLTVDTNVIATKTYADQAETDAVSSANSYTDGEITDALSTAQGYATTAQSNAEDYADGVAGTAEQNAKDYADGLAGNYDAAGLAAAALVDANAYTDGYVGAVLDGTEAFTEINLNSVTSQRAVQTTLSSISTDVSVMSWAKSDYPTAKLWVKFATATHSQISEVLLTADSSNNIAITEFGIVGTNGNMGSVTAIYSSGNIAVEVDTVYANTTVTVSATLIK